MAARKWTPEQRARQSALISQWQPWAKSTGAKTPEGKAASSRNAYKGSFRQRLRELSRTMNAVFRQQREELESIRNLE